MSAVIQPVKPRAVSLYTGISVPPGASKVHRFAWQSPRWWEWLSYRKLRCPANHHIPNNYELDSNGSGRIRCNEPMQGGHGGCGLWVWATRLPGAGHIVIEVTERDLDVLAKFSTVSEKIDYLGIFEQLERLK